MDELSDVTCCEIGECTHREGRPNPRPNFHITKEEIKAHLVSIRTARKPVVIGGDTPEHRKVWAERLREWSHHE